MESGLKATQLPIGTLLACSFNIPMMEELYVMEGKELVANEVDTLLGPGINIHRYPLNGRNFEYFSEDPYVTGCFEMCIRDRDRILSYFKAEWQVLLAVTISGLIYNVGLLAGPWFEGKMTGCLVDILRGAGPVSYTHLVLITSQRFSFIQS